MKIFITSLVFLAAVIFLSVAHFVFAQTSTPTVININPNIPGSSVVDCSNPASGNCNPAGFVNNFYSFALIIGGILAFGAVVFGGIKYLTAAGNPSGQSEGKEWIEGALIGLLLLGGAYLILKTINPQIVGLQMGAFPQLPASAGGTTGGTGGGTGGGATTTSGLIPPPPANCVPTTASLGTCKNCSNSPGVNSVLSCIGGTAAAGTVSATFNGQHTCNANTGSVSCHFGGKSCSDGSHAFDLGHKALAAKLVSLSQAVTTAQSCGTITGNSVTCYCEGGTTRLPCTDPSADHVHCNVNNASCGCN